MLKMFPIVKSLVSNWLDEKKTTQSGSLEASSKIDKKNQEVTGNNEEILTNEVTSAEGDIKFRDCEKRNINNSILFLVSEDLKAREGTVQDLNDGIFTIKSGDEEFYVEAADTQFIFIKNDKVRSVFVCKCCIIFIMLPNFEGSSQRHCSTT